MKRLIFWDFPRGSRPYDLAVGVILAFIFLTPRAFFKDQPRPSSIVQMPSVGDADIYWLETNLLAGTPEQDRPQRASELLFGQRGKRLHVTHVEPFFDAEQEIKGYMAIVKK
ncbi:MAG: hypothetical protein HY858_00865 [Candidatus Solibacter usitatus]|nr:hypothetical protein [Candidatus Solibacter usitatus]